MAKTIHERGLGRGGRRSLLAALCLVVAVGSAPAWSAGPDDGPIVVHPFKLEHQSAAEAVALIRAHLSERGTVELRPAANTLVIRDVRPAIDAIVPLLRDFDRPGRAVRLEIKIVSPLISSFLYTLYTYV